YGEHAVGKNRFEEEMKLFREEERVNGGSRRETALVPERKYLTPARDGGHGISIARGRCTSSSESGSSLIVTLVIGVVIIIVLMSYLQLLQGRTITRTRSLAWNSAIPILEAGIEEACTQLNE